MEVTLRNNGIESWFSFWAVVCIIMGVGFLIILPHIGTVVFALPIPIGLALFAIWQAFYANPQVLLVKDTGIELRFRSKEPIFVSWQEVERIDLPMPDPFPDRPGTKPLSLGSLWIRPGPKSHPLVCESRLYYLAYETAKALSELKQECEIK